MRTFSPPSVSSAGRRGSLRRAAGAACAAALAVSGTVASVAPARADEVTVSVDALRTGWDTAEPGLSPQDVSAADFGQQFATAVDGQVYAQPLIAGSTAVVATENNNVYGVDTATGAKKWTRALGPAWPVSTIGCGDLTPNIGVTSTPVYDAASGTVYLTAKVNDGPTAQQPHWYLHALDVGTGAERPGWPVTITGSPANDPGSTFNPYTSMQRAGLLLLDGVVYAGFGSHCDIQPYRGYVVGVNVAQKKIATIWTSAAGAQTNANGIWHAGGGLVSDGSGRIFLATGNGVTPPPGPGSTPPVVLSESVVRLGINPDGTLSPKDFFAPSNADQLDRDDTDLGSGGPMALPAPFGTPGHPHLLVQVGKDGRVFLLDRDDLGGRGQGSGGGDKVVGVTGPFQGVWGYPAFWGGDGGYAYVVGNGGPLRALKYGVDGAGTPTLAAAGASTGSYGYTSGSPVVTSDGSTSGSALVWVVYSSGPGGAAAELRAYDAVPVNGVLNLRFSTAIGTAVKFGKIATDGGRVFVGTRDGKLLAFGRPSTSALQTPGVDFGSVQVGASSPRNATVTATRTVTITGISAGPPFAATPPTLPVTLTAGQTLTTAVTFTPAAAGGVTGTLTYRTDAGTLGQSLRGTGTKAGLAASPSALDFGTIGTGTTKNLSVDIVNTGDTATTVTAVTPPAAPFTATGLPAVGSSIPAGGSVSVGVGYAPTAAGTQTATLSVVAGSGQVGVPLTGTAVSGAPVLTLTPTTLDYGPVPVGQSTSKTFAVSNTGTVALTITKAKAPAGAFSAASQLPEGLVLNPGQSVNQSVTFAPTAAGVATASYEITGSDGRGAQYVTLTGSGVAALPAPTGTGWTRNGAATVSGADLVLTPAAPTKAGSAVYGTPVGTEGLHASFTAQIGGGTGADGLTFALLDATKATGASLGATGGGLGYGGLPGVAVALDTYRNAGDPSANLVGVATGLRGTATDQLAYAGTFTLPTALTSGTHTVDVNVSGGHVRVAVDGTARVDAVVTVPARALLAFTAGTGGATDVHTIRGVTITAPAAALLAGPARTG